MAAAAGVLHWALLPLPEEAGGEVLIAAADAFTPGAS
jgi:hypothetical protein